MSANLASRIFDLCSTGLLAKSVLDLSWFGRKFIFCDNKKTLRGFKISFSVFFFSISISELTTVSFLKKGSKYARASVIAAIKATPTREKPRMARKLTQKLVLKILDVIEVVNFITARTISEGATSPNLDFPSNSNFVSKTKDLL